MSDTRAIPPALEATVLELYGQGRSTREIAEQLAAQGCAASASSVARFLVAIRRERAEVLKDAVRSKLAPGVLGDLERLEQRATELDGLAAGALVPGKERLYLQICEAQRRVLHTKLHFAGLDTPTDAADEQAEAAAGVDRELDRLAAAARAGGDAPAAGPDPDGASSAPLRLEVLGPP